MDFLRNLYFAARGLPIYAGLLVLLLAGFGWAGWHGVRVFGDDNESTDTVDGPSGRSHGSGYRRGYSHTRFYHK